MRCANCLEPLRCSCGEHVMKPPPTITRAEIMSCFHFDVWQEVVVRLTEKDLITLLRSKGIEVVE